MPTHYGGAAQAVRNALGRHSPTPAPAPPAFNANSVVPARRNAVMPGRVPVATGGLLGSGAAPPQVGDVRSGFRAALDGWMAGRPENMRGQQIQDWIAQRPRFQNFRNNTNGGA